MHTPPEALADTEAYLWICSLGIPFIIGYNVVCGILRGLGDSRTPLYFVALACALNIVLDFILVGGCHLRAAGAGHSHGRFARGKLCYGLVVSVPERFPF